MAQERGVMGFGMGGIESLINSGIKDPRANVSTTSSAWGELAQSLVAAAGAVGVAALQKSAGVTNTQALAARNVLTTPGQPTQQKPASSPINKSTIIIAVFVVLLGSGLVYFAFKR